MVMHIFYVFSPAPVHCNDNKSDTFSNQSTSDHNDSSNDNIHSSERGCFGSKNVEKFLIPSYYDKPDVGDICALTWGLHHYMLSFFPH